VGAGKAVRTEEIGQMVGAMFVDVRDAIKRQIQDHVEGAGRAAPAEDSQVRAGAVRGREGTMVSPSGAADLPVLNVGGGSGSGVVSNPRSAVTDAPSPGSAGGVRAGLAPASGGAPASATAPGGVSRSGLVGAFAVLLVAAVAASVGTQWYMSQRGPPTPVAQSDFTTGPVSPPQAGSTTTAPAGPSVTAIPSAIVATPAPSAGNPPPALPVISASASATPAGIGLKTAHNHHAPPAAAPTPPPAADTLGYVTFDTYPWTRVSEGGTLIGTTPLVRVPLPAGSHTFTLDNPEQGIHQTFPFTLKAGDSMTKRLGLK
jgi:serine/threonine-protein kinase